MFNWGKFTSHSGLELDYKIDCDNLTDKDLACLAALVAQKVRFGKVIGIPRGGLRFSYALGAYTDPAIDTILIVDDVLTTGSSIMEEMCKHKNVLGVVIFKRITKHFKDIVPIFNLNPMWI